MFSVSYLRSFTFRRERPLLFKADEHDVADAFLQLPEKSQGVGKVFPFGVVDNAVKSDLLQSVCNVLAVLDEATHSKRRVGQGQVVGLPAHLTPYRTGGAVAGQNVRALVALRIRHDVLRLHVHIAALMPPDGFRREWYGG